MKGMYVTIYRRPGSDCTSNGFSSNRDAAVLVGENVPEIHAARQDNALILHRHGSYLWARPASVPDDVICMFGGNFIYSSDSCFPSRQPIHIHDRIENV